MKEEKIMRERMFKPQGVSEKESFEEQMAELNVPVIKKNNNAVTVVKWMRKRIYGPPAVTLTGQQVYFNVAAVEKLKPRGKFYDFGVGDYEGQRVILLREAERGYRLSFPKNKNYAASKAPGLVEQLIGAGIKPGRYVLREIKSRRGNWMGVPANG